MSHVARTKPRFVAISEHISVKILVIGKAKTGTTVVANTIKESLPKSRLVMEPKSPRELLITSGADKDNSVTKVIFEHWDQRPRSRNALVNGELIPFDKVVFILRDPRDELVSRLVYFVVAWNDRNPGNDDKVGQWIGLLKRKERNPSSISLLEMAKHRDAIFGGQFMKSLNLVRVYSDFLARRPVNSFVVRYEDFVRNNRKELEDYLELGPLLPASGLPDHYTRRTASFGNWKCFLLQEDVDYIQSKFGKAIEECGYADWNLETASSLDAEHYSGYVEKLLAKRRMSTVQKMLGLMRARRAG